jgi:hypothetical protein
MTLTRVTYVNTGVEGFKQEMTYDKTAVPCVRPVISTMFR